MPTPLPHSVAQHFDGKHKDVRATFDRILAIAREWGEIRLDARKASINLMHENTAFASVATRKDALVLTLKAEEDVRSPRISKHKHGASTWSLEVKLVRPQEVDHELQQWLRASFALSK
jgi:hypothetical protein